MKARRLGLFSLAVLFVAACGGDDKKPSPDVISDTTGPACGGDLGTTGCECRADGSCDEGLTCNLGTCESTVITETGLVLPAGVRGCEILLRESSGRVSDVVFAADVNGTFVREAPHIAITLVNKADADFASGAVTLKASGTTELVSAKCVDTTGAEVAGASVVLQ